MISEKKAKKYCNGDISKIENYDKAFADKDETWDFHHRAEMLPCGNFSRDTLKKYDLYYNRPSEELILLTHSEHTRLHITPHITHNYSRIEFESAPKTKEEVLAILKPLKLSKKCFMQKLARIGAMCSLYNCFQDLTVLNISQTSPHLLKVFKFTPLIHKTIKQSIQIGLLKCVDNSFSKKRHICKKYLWNIEVKRIVLDLVQEYEINSYNGFNLNELTKFSEEINFYKNRSNSRKL